MGARSRDASTTGSIAARVVVIATCAAISLFGVRALGGQQSPVAPVPCLETPVVASPVAGSPVAMASPQARAESPITVAVSASVANIIACWNDADWQTSSLFVTDNFLAQTFGSPDRAAYVALQERLEAVGLSAGVSLIGVETVRDVGTGFATADVLWQHGDAIKSERWHVAQVDGRWAIDQIRPLPPEISGDAVGIELIVEGSGIRLSRDRLVSPGIVVIRVRNLTSESFSISLVRLATLDEVRARLSGGPSVGNDPVLSGQITIADYEEHDLVLAGLREGDYVIVAGVTIPFGPDQIRDEFSASLSVTLP